MSRSNATYAVLGDLHGHLQLGLCTLARWQRERGRAFSAVFLVGDVGTFTEDHQLDAATQKHARTNPCELEFLKQWSTHPPAPWIDLIFQSAPEGLGLCCPVVMVHGNHEGFEHLETLYPRRRRPASPVPVAELPAVDTNGWIRFLPPGWTTITPEGHTIGGAGGMERRQRRAKYHDLAYIDEDAVRHLALRDQTLDVLLTHQGPSVMQGEHGSPTLDQLLEPAIAPYWFHGHSIPQRTPQVIAGTTIVPLGDIAFQNRVAGTRGWAILDIDGNDYHLTTAPPDFLPDLSQHLWHRTPDGHLIHPDLIRLQNPNVP